MDLQALGRILIIIAVVALVVGIGLVVLGAFVGRLPGDIVIRRNGLTIFIPIVTMILISIILTIVLNAVARWFR